MKDIKQYYHLVLLLTHNTAKVRKFLCAFGLNFIVSKQRHFCLMDQQLHRQCYHNDEIHDQKEDLLMKN